MMLDRTTWKTLAIIFFIIAFIETSLIGWGVYITMEEDKDIKECYYNICGDYPEADLTDDVCTCYDYGVLGDFVIADTEYMK